MAGKRLPSMLEWEKAALGTDGRLYPWGDQAGPDRATLRGSAGSQNFPWPANRFAEDKSPWGVLNMEGNVAELIDEVRAPSAAAIKHFGTATATEAWYVVRGSLIHIPPQRGDKEFVSRFV